jgi:hypothetical protein
MPQINEQFDRWTRQHEKAAMSQGWLMSNFDRRGLLQLQRYDEAEIFERDADALDFVRSKAAEGDATAALALELHAFFDPLIYPSDDAGSKPRLPAAVQPQIWVNDNAVDSGSSIAFDAHDAMLGTRAANFRRMAEEILRGIGHDYDDLALDAGVIGAWLNGSEHATFYVTVDEHDFRDWLEALDITEEEALEMNDELLQQIREKAAAGVEAPSFGK